MNMKVQPIPGKNLAISFMMALVPCVCGWCGVWSVCVCVWSGVGVVCGGVWSGVGVVCGGVWSGCGSTCERIYIYSGHLSLGRDQQWL